MTTPPDPGVRDPGEIASAPDNPGPPDAARVPDASGTPVAPGMADAPGTPDAGGTRDAPGASGDPVSLLVSAVGQLPPEQRDLVFTWLLRQRPALARQWTLGATTLESDELQSLQRAAGPAGIRGLRPAGRAGQVSRRAARPAAGVVRGARLLDGHRDPRAGGPFP